MTRILLWAITTRRRRSPRSCISCICANVPVVYISDKLLTTSDSYSSLVLRKTPTYGWFNFTFLLIRSIKVGFVI
ncbi:hypothetical protein L798_03410 [Zootermopsis nevadensis]|uniref:Uncharacterized protein n=1 Tax=Zootermopsis nevadensis TaxID=136037 RepID=A0A067QQR3_ZOONE|nr:hypothetical protein L798_03410 [Zootermopsis nevadensis]